MRQLAVLICDDDPMMRELLSTIVEGQEGYRVIGQAASGTEALDLFERFRPEVVFLDVEIPEPSGVVCAHRIADLAPDTCIIFATAHPDYRAQAFEVYAFDYLVKPFDLERVQETLTRIRAVRTAAHASPVTEAHPSAPLKKLVIRHKEGMTLVDTEAIILIQREDRSTVIYTAEDRIVCHESLSDLMERLDAGLFFRSHKSYIINLSCVTRIYPYGRWTYVVKLKGLEQDALITSERFEELEKRMAQ